MPAETEQLGSKTVKNSLFSLVAFLWPILLAFFTTPFIVHGLGNENYGILALVTSFIGFFGFLDFGISPSLVKYTSEYYATRELHKLNQIFSSALAFYLLIGAFAGVLIVSFSYFVAPHIIKVAPSNIHTLRTVLYIAAAGFMINMILSAFSAIPGSLQRFDLASYVNLFISTTVTILTVILVALGKGVVALSLLAVSFSALAILIYARINKKLIPELKIIPRLDAKATKLMFGFGAYAVVTSIATVALFQLDKIILGGQLGASAVTYYVVPGNLAIKIWGLANAATTVVFPLSSALLATQNMEKLQHLYRRATKFVLLFLIITITPIYAIANKFLLYWIGADFAHKSTTVLQLLTGTYSVLALTAIPYYILFGAGKPKLTALNTTISAVLNVVLILVLVPRLGINGAAIAYLLSVIPGALIYMVFVERRIVRFDSLQFYVPLLPKLLILAGFSLGLALYSARFATSLVGILLLYVAVMIATGLLAILLRVFGEEDRVLLRSMALRLSGRTG